MSKSDALLQINHIKIILESLLAKEAEDLDETKLYLSSILDDIKRIKSIMQNETLETEIDKIGSKVRELLELLSNKTLSINDKDFETHISTMLDTIKNIIRQTSIPNSDTQATSLEAKKYYKLQLSGETIAAIKLAINKPVSLTLGGERKSRKSGRTARRTRRTRRTRRSRTYRRR